MSEEVVETKAARKVSLWRRVMLRLRRGEEGPESEELDEEFWLKPRGGEDGVYPPQCDRDLDGRPAEGKHDLPIRNEM